MATTYQVAPLETSCSTLSLATGGGKECLQILFTMSEIAQGVQQCQKVEKL